jgi:hypothetical protein
MWLRLATRRPVRLSPANVPHQGVLAALLAQIPRRLWLQSQSVARQALHAACAAKTPSLHRRAAPHEGAPHLTADMQQMMLMQETLVCSVVTGVALPHRRARTLRHQRLLHHRLHGTAAHRASAHILWMRTARAMPQTCRCAEAQTLRPPACTDAAPTRRSAALAAAAEIGATGLHGRVTEAAAHLRTDRRSAAMSEPAERCEACAAA